MIKNLGTHGTHGKIIIRYNIKALATAQML